MRYLIAFFLIGFSIIGNCQTQEEIIIKQYALLPSLASINRIDTATPSKIMEFVKDLKSNTSIYKDRKRKKNVTEAVYQKAVIEEKNRFIQKLQENNLSPLRTFFVLKRFLSFYRVDKKTQNFFVSEVINKVIVAILEGALGLTQVSLSEETKQQWETSLVETVLLTYNSDDFIDDSNSLVHYPKPSNSIFFKTEQEKIEKLQKSGLSQDAFEQHIQKLKEVEKEIYNTLVEADEVNFKSIPCWDLIDESLKKKIMNCPEIWFAQQRKVMEAIRTLLQSKKLSFYSLGDHLYEEFLPFSQKFDEAYQRRQDHYSDDSSSPNSFFSLHDYISDKQILEVWSWIKDVLTKVAKGERDSPYPTRIALFLMNDKDIIKRINELETNELISSLLKSILENKRHYCVDCGDRDSHFQLETLIASTPFITRDMVEKFKDYKIDIEQSDDTLCQDLIDILAKEGVPPLPNDELKKEIDNFFKTGPRNCYILYRAILQTILQENDSVIEKTFESHLEENKNTGEKIIIGRECTFRGKTIRPYRYVIFSLLARILNYNINTNNIDAEKDWWKYIFLISKEKMWETGRESYIEYQTSEVNIGYLYFFELLEQPDLLKYVIEKLGLTSKELNRIYENQLMVLHCCTKYLNDSLENIQGRVNKKEKSLKFLQSRGVNLAKLNLSGKTILGHQLTLTPFYYTENNFNMDANFLQIILRLDDASQFFKDYTIVKNKLEGIINKLKDEPYREKRKELNLYQQLLDLYNDAFKKAKSKVQTL